VTIIGAYAKNSKVQIPLNSLVHEALTRLPYPSDAEWVFTTARGIPYKSVRGFNDACKRHLMA